MKIKILDDYQNIIESLDCFRILEGIDVEIIHHTEKDVNKLALILCDADVVVLTRERTVISSELLEKLPKLKLISQTGKISNHLNLKSCIEHGVAVAEGEGSPIAPAELTWALILNTIRKIPQSIEAMKMGKWQVNIGSKISGKTVGIWGYGKIGQKIAQYAKAFDAKVLVWGSETSREKALNDGFQSCKSKEEFFSNADIVTLHLRLNKETTGVVKFEDLKLMKLNSVFINTARAELVEKGAIASLLQLRNDIMIGLDVYEDEPIYDSNFNLLNFSNVVCTPHLGYVEKDGYELYFGKAFENVINFINGNPTNIANIEVL